MPVGGRSARSPEKILQVSRSQMGRADTLRYNVNYFLVEEDYDRAIEEIERYKKLDIDLPKYMERITPYLNHAIDLINAIRNKRSLFDNPSLTRSKKQEIRETVYAHYEDLQSLFKRIDQTRYQLQMEDVRSTTWVLQTLVLSGFLLTTVFLLRELTSGMLYSFDVVWSDLTEKVVNWIFQTLDI